MNQKVAKEVVRRFPPHHGWVVVVAAAVTAIFVSQDGKEVLISLFGRVTERGVAESDQQGGPAVSTKPVAGEFGPSRDAVATAASEQGPPAEPTAAPEVVRQKTAEPAQPAEQMVPMAVVNLLVETMRTQNAENRETIAELRTQLTQVLGKCDQLQTQIATLETKRAKDSWESVDRFRDEQMFGVPSRTDTFRIDERNGVTPVDRTPENRPDVRSEMPTSLRDNGPYKAESEDMPPARSELKPEPTRRTGYVNVSGSRTLSHTTFDAGTSRSRLQAEKDRHQAAIEWTRQYRAGSASSRLLGELERGSR